jgi:hypothetical protein
VYSLSIPTWMMTGLCELPRIVNVSVPAMGEDAAPGPDYPTDRSLRRATAVLALKMALAVL